MGSSGKQPTPPRLPSAQAILAGTARSLDRFQELVGTTRDAEATRLVWYVAISGYVASNGEPYWSKLLGREATGTDLYWLTLPWIIAAVAALIAHVVALKRIDAEHLQFYAQRSRLDVYAEIETDPERAYQTATSVLDAEGPLEKYQLVTRRWDCASKVTRGVAFCSLLVAFVWMLCGPRYLR